MEDAPARRLDQVGEGARDRCQPAAPASRERSEQAPRVGVERLAEDVSGRPLLDHAAGVEDRDALAQTVHDAEVVADEEEAALRRRPQVLDEVQDLRLDRHVERRRRLVEEEKRGVAGERGGDQRALLHPAAQLVRIRAGHRGGRAGSQPGRGAPGPLRSASARPSPR